MKIKKIPTFIGSAKKMRHKGVIEYCLWVDYEGGLYVQFEENNVHTKEPGTFKGLLYPVSKYAGYRHGKDAIPTPKGFNLESRQWDFGADRNNPGFLKAVLRDLLP